MVNQKVAAVFVTKGSCYNILFRQHSEVLNHLFYFFKSSFRSTVRLQAHEAEHLAEAGEEGAIPTEEVESYLVISMEN